MKIKYMHKRRRHRWTFEYTLYK